MPLTGCYAPEAHAKPGGATEASAAAASSDDRAGRQPQVLRRVCLQPGCLGRERCAGSALVELGSTKVLVSVHGPRPASTNEYRAEGTLALEVLLAPFAASAGGAGVSARAEADRAAASAVHAALAPSVRLERYPKSTVDVVCVVLSGDGGELPACIVGASLALADAGVELLDLVAAASAGVYGDEAPIRVDVSRSEAALAAGVTTVAAMGEGAGDVTLWQQHGRRCSADRALTAMKIAVTAAAQVRRLMREALLATLG